MKGPFTVSAPGRICLFGEHQDYLGLPVIAMAINLRIWVSGEFNDSGFYEVDLPDVGERERVAVSFPLPYVRERDYLRSTLNILWRDGIPLPRGLSARVHGNIPLNSGTSSSSALCVAWTRFLLCYWARSRRIDPFQLAKWAHRAEVVEFGEPGGMMDHVLSALGGVAYVEFEPELYVQRLPVELGAFVLGDSGEQKQTKTVLARVRTAVEAAVRRLKELDEAFDLRTIEPRQLHRIWGVLPPELRDVLEGTIRNREITQQALGLLSEETVDKRKLGLLMLEHQRINRDLLRISTPRLDALVRAATEAGALGGKLNGSGGGGAMFAYAPEAPEQVKQALESAQARAWIIRADVGARVEEAPSGPG